MLQGRANNRAYYYLSNKKMFNKSSNKVKFQDQQLDDYELEVINNHYIIVCLFSLSSLQDLPLLTIKRLALLHYLQNSVLKSKLQSKIDALSIMSKELDKCSMERDRYKVLVEQLKCKKPVTQTKNPPNWYNYNPTIISGGEMLAKTRDHNNMLKLEVIFKLYSEFLNIEMISII